MVFALHLSHHVSFVQSEIISGLTLS